MNCRKSIVELTFTICAQEDVLGTQERRELASAHRDRFSDAQLVRAQRLDVVAGGPWTVDDEADVAILERCFQLAVITVHDHIGRARRVHDEGQPVRDPVALG